MSLDFCIICEDDVDDFNWKYTDIETEEGKKSGWICSKHFTPTTYEHIPERIKLDRKKYAKDVLQPFRQGEPSREFIEAYPSQAKKTFTKEQIRKSKYVWKGDV